MRLILPGFEPVFQCYTCYTVINTSGDEEVFGKECQQKCYTKIVFCQLKKSITLYSIEPIPFVQL